MPLTSLQRGFLPGWLASASGSQGSGEAALLPRGSSQLFGPGTSSRRGGSLVPPLPCLVSGGQQVPRHRAMCPQGLTVSRL